ncbi:hypothetical protein [Staphylococcus xylosus]
MICLKLIDFRQIVTLEVFRNNDIVGRNATNKVVNKIILKTEQENISPSSYTML